MLFIHNALDAIILKLNAAQTVNIYQFRHRRATKRNLFRRQLQKSEYLWGITRTAEAGLESCGQLILQVCMHRLHGLYRV